MGPHQPALKAVRARTLALAARSRPDDATTVQLRRRGSTEVCKHIGTTIETMPLEACMSVTIKTGGTSNFCCSTLLLARPLRAVGGMASMLLADSLRETTAALTQNNSGAQVFHLPEA